MTSLTPFRALLRLALFAPLLLVAASGSAQETDIAPAEWRDRFARWEFRLEGAERSAWIYTPPSAKTVATPVVFAFHGHGGSAGRATRMFGIQRHWPEAISVYMQGLNTPGRLSDREGRKSGWQRRVGDQGDRDLKFFDAMLARLKEQYRIDEKRIYATGHSNGGAFTYLLWETRGSVFAALAPSASAAPAARSLQPKPALHLAGESDPLVRFQWQRATIDALRKVNGCAAEGQPWGRYATLFNSETGTPLVEVIHPGGHEFPPRAAELIVRFFQTYPPQAADKSKR